MRELPGDEPLLLPYHRNRAEHREVQGEARPLDNRDQLFWNLPMFDDDATVEVGGLDTAPHLESGTCWWFSPKKSEFEERPDDPGRKRSFRQVIRVKRHTGKTNSGSDDAEMEVGRAPTIASRNTHTRGLTRESLRTGTPSDASLMT